MKTITIKLTKPGHSAAAKMIAYYDDASWPSSTVWTGDRAAFALSDGSLPTLLASADRIEEVVIHQASQSGAHAEITKSGSCPLRSDNVLE